jgi:hypothetical protein
MSKFNAWRCNTARLGFAFQDASPAPFEHGLSDYVESKMDTVISIFDSYGLKVILLNQNSPDIGDHQHYLGSTNWVNNWKAIATHYKGDTRIAGFALFGEPTPDTWATSGPLGNINTKEKFMQVCKYLIDEIRAIDPARRIFFPTCAGMGIGYDNPTTTYNAMVTAGIIAQGNIIMDINHPYYWENEWDLKAGISPEQAVTNLMNEIIDPAIGLWGAENLWIGETFAWYPNLTHDLQVRFLTALINACVERNIGIQVWSYFGKQSRCNEALQASNY